MALFSGDTTTITTPDGRTLTLPVEVAAQFPGFKPAPAAQENIAPSSPAPPSPELPGPGPGPAPAGGPVTLPSGGTPVFTQADAAAAAALTPPPDASAAPVTSPRQVPSGGPELAPRATGPITQPGPDQGTQAPAPTRDLTNADLAKLGPAGTLAAETRALGDQATAIRQSAQIEADTATKQGHILAARDVETQRILEERKRVADANQAELERRLRDRDQLATQIANTRIDRSVDHPVWAAISAALIGLGQTLNRQPVDAMSAIYQAIDRKVAGQMQDLDNKRKTLADLGVGIAEQRQAGADRLAEIDVRREAAIRQAQQTIESMTAQMKSPLAIAKGKEMIAQLGKERAQLQGQAAERVQAQINAEAARRQALQIHRENLGFQYTQLASQEREKLADVAARLLAEGKKEAADRAAKAAETVIYDPRTGDVQLNPTGQAKFSQADRLEAAARQERDPAKAAQQRQAAIDLRDSARVNDGVRAPDKSTAEKIRSALQAAQSATDQIGVAQKQLESEPSAFNREEWAGIKTRLSNIAVDYTKTVGERVSVKAIDQAMENILSFDPDSIFNRVANQKKALESLKTLKSIVAESADATLRGNGIKSNWVPVARGEDAAKFSPDESTAAELRQKENSGGVLQRIGGRILNPIGGYEGLDFGAKAEADAEARPGAENGLSPTTVAALKGVALRADRAGDAERAKIAESLRAPIAAGLQEGGRNSLAWGMLHTLRGVSPGLYGEVVAGLPPDQTELIRSIDSARAELPGAKLPPPTNKPSGFDPDEAARQSKESEKARGEAADRARRAQKALSEKFGNLGAGQ